MRRLLKYVLSVLRGKGAETAKDTETPRPRRQRYVRDATGSGSRAILTVLEAIQSELEAIRDGLERSK